MIQHLLRRFAFSAPPEMVDQVLASAKGGSWLAAANAWLAEQASATENCPIGAGSDVTETCPVPIEAPPNTAPMNEAGNRNGERSYVEHTIGTDLQLQAKMELHWFDHFSVEGARPGTGRRCCNTKASCARTRSEIFRRC